MRRCLVVAGLCALIGCGGDAADDASDTALADTGDGSSTPASDAGDADVLVDAIDAGQPFPELRCDGEGATAETALGAWTIVTSENGRWAIRNAEGAEVMRGEPTCAGDGDSRVFGLRAGTGDVGYYFNTGTFDIEVVPDRDDTINNAPELEWSVPTTGARVAARDNGVALEWMFGEALVALEFHQQSNEHLHVGVNAPGFAAFELLWEASVDEGFFGLGTQVFGMNLRGGTFPLWTQEQGIGKSRNTYLPLIENRIEAAYAPMGVWHSTAGYSAIVDQDGYQELDLAESVDDQVALRTYPLPPAFVLVTGSSPRDRLEQITTYTGRQQPVPDWAFGPWNDMVGGTDKVVALRELLRERGIPATAMWVEDWIGGGQTANGFRLSYAWEWDEDTYPTLPTLIEESHAAGFAFLGYFNPFVPDTNRMWSEGVEGGYLLQTEDGEVSTFTDPAFRTASLVDLTNPDAVDWVSSYLTTGADTVGLDGWMADFAEWMPVEIALASGEDPWLVHNRYPLLWQRTHRAAMEAVHTGDSEGDWVYFARSGWASTGGGTAGVAPIMWGGDQNTDWEDDDGLPTIVPIAVHAGLAGVGLFATDVAGYASVVSPPTTKELFFRWSMVGAFHPVMRTHQGAEKCDNWQLGRDDETLNHYERWASVHMRLLPVWRSLTAEASARGWPVMRHPWLVEPDVRALWDDREPSFFVGDHLYVQPVWSEGATTRQVVLPGTGWWPLFGDEAVAAGAAPDGTVSTSVNAPATEIPVFVRPGTAIPLLPFAPDTTYPATSDGVTTLEDVGDSLRWALYPDAAGAIADSVWTGLDGRSVALSGGEGWLLDNVSVDGEALPACDGELAECVDATAGIVRVEGPAVVSAGGATATVSAPAGAITELALAGAAWDRWAVPTLLTDLSPDVPSPCDE